MVFNELVFEKKEEEKIVIEQKDNEVCELKIQIEDLTSVNRKLCEEISTLRELKAKEESKKYNLEEQLASLKSELENLRKKNHDLKIKIMN
jgi:hypothetical protein